MAPLGLSCMYSVHTGRDLLCPMLFSVTHGRQGKGMNGGLLDCWSWKGCTDSTHSMHSSSSVFRVLLVSEDGYEENEGGWTAVKMQRFFL